MYAIFAEQSLQVSSVSVKGTRHIYDASLWEDSAQYRGNIIFSGVRAN